MPLAEFPERFRVKVNVLPSGCWEWTACKGPYGHGFFHWRKKQHHAHRWAYQWLHGDINDRRVHLDHYRYPQDGCIGPSCVNPDHVRPTTARENTLRGAAPSSANLSKTHCPQGHEFTPENTKYSSRGNRRCVACGRDRASWKGQVPAEERTHCPQGHEYSGENLYVRPSGGRGCRACRRERMRAAYAAKNSNPRPKGRCRNGHSYSEGHLAITPQGRRYCRTCAKAYRDARRTHGEGGRP